MLVGCDADALQEDDELPADLAQQGASLARQQAGREVTFAEVVANGTGCPAGTSHTAISSDGLTFTTRFDDFVSQVGAELPADVKDCVLAIKLHSPFGRSYAVQTFSYGGYAYLDPGLTARQTATYNFQGNPLPPTDSNRMLLIGPYDESYLFKDEIAVRDRVWSACSLERDLNVTVRVQVQNAADRPGDGYMSLSAVDGSSQMMVRLVERDCDVGAIPTADASVPPAAPDASVPPRDASVPPPRDASVPPPRDASVPAPRDASVPPRDASVPPSADASVPASAPKPTMVRVRPSVIRRDQLFLINWNSASAPADTTYVAEVRMPPDRGGARLWRSGATPLAPIAYEGPSFPAAGLYPVVVIAQRGGVEVTSDAALLDVRDDVSQPTPDAGALPPVPTDAGAASTPTPTDAGAVDAGSASVPIPPLGRYGVRTYGFWQSARGTVLTAKEVAIADVVDTPSGREVQLRVCAQRATSLGAALDLARPDAYPVVRRLLTTTAEGFFSDAQPLSVGFDRAIGAQCAGRGGQQVPKSASQTWIRGSTCRCPSSPDEPPTRDDCRVTDGDGDGNPGLAYRQVGRPGVTLHVASVQRMQYQRGRAEARGTLFANQRIDERAYQLDCSTSSSECPSLAGAQPCTSDDNGVDFVPLPPSVSWNCATLLANEQQLFTKPLPSAPRTCTREASP
ncbi:MAG: DUF4360 domain-containing protein [Polyangiales bacterium]